MPSGSILLFDHENKRVDNIVFNDKYKKYLNVLKNSL